MGGGACQNPWANILTFAVIHDEEFEKTYIKHIHYARLLSLGTLQRPPFDTDCQRVSVHILNKEGSTKLSLSEAAYQCSFKDLNPLLSGMVGIVRSHIQFPFNYIYLKYQENKTI